MAVAVQVTFDCANVARMVEFWSSALGYIVQPPPAGFESWEAFLTARQVPKEFWDAFSAAIDPDGKGPRLFFQKVPEGKTAKNRVHLDMHVGPDNVEATIERLAASGATKIGDKNERGEHWVVMHDPEGNEFCVE